MKSGGFCRDFAGHLQQTHKTFSSTLVITFIRHHVSGRNLEGCSKQVVAILVSDLASLSRIEVSFPAVNN